MLRGIQGAVIAWLDPWDPEGSARIYRTGERERIAVQDRMPQPKELVAVLQTLRADFYLHQLIPGEDEGFNRLVSDMRTAGLSVMIGNEYGNANGNHTYGTNRFDLPPGILRCASDAGVLLGTIYDETGHLQLHPDIYRSHLGLPCGRHQWVSDFPSSDSDASRETRLVEIRRQVMSAIRATLANCQTSTDSYAEAVFPAMYHTLAAGGLNPAPKLLKEEFYPVQIASAAGAARQYRRKLAFCVDLWGPDVGPWFTRYWALPGHSPEEFAAALELAERLAPDLIYVENMDPLARVGQRTELTEFGDVLRASWAAQGQEPVHARGLSHWNEIVPTVAIVCSDDSDCGTGSPLWGCPGLMPDELSRSVFTLFSLLSHGQIPSNGLTYFLPQFRYHATELRAQTTEAPQFPLGNGLCTEDTGSHLSFASFPSAMVFDEHADYGVLRDAGLIVVAGSSLSVQTWEALVHASRQGARVALPRWLVPHTQRRVASYCKGMLVADDMDDPRWEEWIEPWRAPPNEMQFRFGRQTLRALRDGSSARMEFAVENCRPDETVRPADRLHWGRRGAQR